MNKQHAVDNKGKETGAVRNHASSITNHQLTISKRSNVMNTTQFIGRGLTALFALFLMAATAFGQNLNLNGSGATLGGTWNVKGNLNTGAASAGYTFSGTMNLNGTGGTQSVGGTTGTPQNLTIANLNTSSTSTRTQTSPTVTVSTALALAGGSYAVSTKTLSIGGTSTGTVLDASNASSTVNYTGGGSQTILASTYGGALGLSGAGGKSFGGVVSAGTVTHTGGALTVDQNFTVTANAASSLDAISISAAKTLAYQGTNTLTIATVSSINATGVIEQNTGASGTIAFTNGFTNGGTIQTGTGVLTFNGALNNTGGSVILTSAGTANFAADITALGTLTFGSSSTVNYTGGSAQTLAGVAYGNLNMSGVGIKTASAGVTINTAFANGSATTDMSTFTLGGAGTKAQGAGGTMRFGGTTNGVIFAAGTVEYNRAGAQDIAGHASNTYSILVLSGSGTKTVTTGAGGTVHTTSNFTVPSGVTLDVVASGVLQVDADLNVNGTGAVTNAGTITVGA